MMMYQRRMLMRERVEGGGTGSAAEIRASLVCFWLCELGYCGIGPLGRSSRV